MLQRSCEILTEGLIYLMVLFSPWAFGTTQRWAIWTMNIAGYVLGMLWLVQRIAAWFQGYDLSALKMSRAAGVSERAHGYSSQHSKGSFVLCGLTAVLLVYCLVSAFNARATFHPETATFDYHDCCRWLPHSFDSASTWFAFWTYLALACSLCSVHDWLFGNTTAEVVATCRTNAEKGRASRRKIFPARTARLLMLLALNGGLLAGECLVQRLSNSPKLLFLVKPRIHQTAATQFGPYAYRANAAQYLNLLWPVSLGFWFANHRRAAREGQWQPVLLFSAGLMCVASLLSGSRAGAVVCGGILAGASLCWALGLSFLCFGRLKAALSILVFGTPVLGLALAWSELAPASPPVRESIAQRQRIYGVGLQMAKDFGVFGAGPGTYESVSELYRPADGSFWPAQAHNDWLETLITFGPVGSLLVVLALLSLLWHARHGQTPCGKAFIYPSLLGLAGCLAHAGVDFPFQVHSVVFLFVVVSAVVLRLSGAPSRKPGWQGWV